MKGVCEAGSSGNTHFEADLYDNTETQEPKSRERERKIEKKLKCFACRSGENFTTEEREDNLIMGIVYI